VIKPSKEEIEEILAYVEGDSKGPMRSKPLGKGSSREVYPLKGSLEHVIKIQKPVRNRAFASQNRTEVGVYLEHPRLRRWLPHVYSFDEERFVWIVVERCSVGVDITKMMRSWASCVLDLIGDEKVKAQTARLLKDLSFRRALERNVERFREKPETFQDFSILAETLADELASYGEACCENSDSLRAALRLWEKGGDLQSLAEVPICSFPLLADFIVESVEQGLNFRDLHNRNFGLALSSAEPKLLRLRAVDVGIVSAKSLPQS